LSKRIGEPKNTFYALFLKKLDPQLEYKLKQNNVEVFIDTPQNFIKTLSYEVSLRNPGDLTKKRILLGNDIVFVDATKIGRFLSFFYPVFFEELEEIIGAKSFFQGNTSSFKPFDNNWHYQRKEIDEIVKTVCSSATSKIISVLGYPGTGRTFTSLAAINKLIQDYNSLAIRIPDYSINRVPEFEDLNIYLSEVIAAAKKRGINPARLIFFANFELDLNDLKKFNKLSENCNFPLFLIFEDQSSRRDTLSKFFAEDITFIEVDRYLDQTEKGELEKYLLENAKIHEFPEISPDQVHEIVSQERQFLPIMYRTLDPTKRSINRIIEEDYNDSAKKNSALKDCISFCAISSYFGISMPISILRNGLQERLRKTLTYNDVLELIDESYRFIKITRDIRGDYYLSIHHNIIAEQVVILNRSNITDEYLESLANSIDLREKVESDFFGSLFIENGVNKIDERSGAFSYKGLIKAFESIKMRQPARPVLHHLARLYERDNINDHRILPLLEEALNEPNERYYLGERKENILTTKAKIMWNRDRENLIRLSITDPKIKEITGLLDEAKTSRNPGPHPYDVHVRILRDLWSIKEGDEKFELINMAIDQLNEGLDRMEEGQFDSDRLNELLIECISEIDPSEAEEEAKRLINISDNGIGYYILARIEYHRNKDFKKSLDCLDNALGAGNFPLRAIALKIEILINQAQPNYKELLDLADKIPDNIFEDSWKTAYHKAIIYCINGYIKPSKRYFQKCGRLRPKTLFKLREHIFWKENGHRKVFSGNINPRFSSKSGWIYSHDVPEWDSEIYFRPIEQTEYRKLKAGMTVNFSLGFNTLGPIGFDITSYKSRKS